MTYHYEDLQGEVELHQRDCERKREYPKHYCASVDHLVSILVNPFRRHAFSAIEVGKKFCFAVLLSHVLVSLTG